MDLVDNRVYELLSVLLDRFALLLFGLVVVQRSQTHLLLLLLESPTIGRLWGDRPIVASPIGHHGRLHLRLETGKPVWLHHHVPLPTR